TWAEARAPMGMHKRDHLRVMLQMPDVARRWAELHGRVWTEADIDDLYQDVMPRQLAAIDKHSKLIPGVVECVAWLRSRGIRIAGTTGYFQAAADRVLEAARQQGYAPDCSICGDEVPRGRPAPWMIFRVMERLDVYPPAAVVKIGDTLVDIADG